MENFKIKVLPGEFIFQYPYFNYLTQDEKHEIKDDVDAKISIIIGVFDDNETEIKAAMVLDFLNDSLHLRSTAGKFIKYRFPLDVFTTALAKFYNKSKLTLSDTNIKLFMVRKMGFQHNGVEYERLI